MTSREETAPQLLTFSVEVLKRAWIDSGIQEHVYACQDKVQAHTIPCALVLEEKPAHEQIQADEHR